MLGGWCFSSPSAAAFAALMEFAVPMFQCSYIHYCLTSGAPGCGIVQEMAVIAKIAAYPGTHRLGAHLRDNRECRNMGTQE